MASRNCCTVPSSELLSLRLRLVTVVVLPPELLPELLALALE